MVDKIMASSKTYEHSVGFSCCFRQWRADSHCRYLHGYALQVKLEFRSLTLDKNNWVMDFGGLKPIKEWLVQKFDHKMLVAEDDPLKHIFLSMEHDEDACQVTLVDNVGCESFANMIFDYVNNWLSEGRIYLYSVEVREHPGNGATVYRKGG